MSIGRHRQRGDVAGGLSSIELGRMLDEAGTKSTVDCPPETFHAVLTLAKDAALARTSPSFTVGELEAMLEALRNQEPVDVTADDFRHLLALAMSAAPIE